MAATDEDGYNVLTNNQLIVCDTSFFTQVLIGRLIWIINDSLEFFFVLNCVFQGQIRCQRSSSRSFSSKEY